MTGQGWHHGGDRREEVGSHGPRGTRDQCLLPLWERTRPVPRRPRSPRPPPCPPGCHLRRYQSVITTRKIEFTTLVKKCSLVFFPPFHYLLINNVHTNKDERHIVSLQLYDQTMELVYIKVYSQLSLLME